MSIKQMAKVWELDLDHAQRLVLLALADHAHDDGGGCRPALGLVAWKTGYSLASVKRIVGQLRRAGLLQVVKEGGGRYATVYRLCLEMGNVKFAYKPLISEREGAHFDTGITRDTAAVSPVIPQPSVEPSKEQLKTLVPHAPMEIVRTPDGVLQLSPSLLEQWQTQFPLVDVPGWLAFIEQYARARPTWAHKRRNWRLTILRWLRVEQERATAKGLTRPGQDETLAQRKEELRRMLRPKEAVRA